MWVRVKLFLFLIDLQVQIFFNVTEETKNISLHAVDMKIDEGETNVSEYIFTTNRSRNIKIIDQFNDTARQFHVIRLGEPLKAGKQYLLAMKFQGYLNDYLQGFYRSSYTVGNETR